MLHECPLLAEPLQCVNGTHYALDHLESDMELIYYLQIFWAVGENIISVDVIFLYHNKIEQSA